MGRSRLGVGNIKIGSRGFSMLSDLRYGGLLSDDERTKVAQYRISLESKDALPLRLTTIQTSQSL